MVENLNAFKGSNTTIYGSSRLLCIDKCVNADLVFEGTKEHVGYMPICAAVIPSLCSYALSKYFSIGF